MAPRPSSASIGYRPSCVVLTFGSMGMEVCPTAPADPADCPLTPPHPGPPRQAGRGSRLGKDAQRQIEGNAPVWLVDDLADPQVAGQAAQDVRVLAAQTMVRDQPLDGVADGVAGVLHEVGTQRRDGVIPRGVAARLERSGGRDGGIGPRTGGAGLYHPKTGWETHWAFDTRKANFAGS